jgi:hypothetical protein
MNTQTRNIEVPTNVIYNTPATNNQRSSFKLRDTGWKFTDIHPATNKPNWFNERGQDSFLQLLQWNGGDGEYYQWVHSELIRRWGTPFDKITPYDFPTLLGQVCPQLFGIYQDTGSIIQLNHKRLYLDGTFVHRYLNIRELNSYLWTQMNSLHHLFSDNHLGKRVFNTKIDYKLNISEDMIIHLLPQLQMDDEIVFLHIPGVVNGRPKMGLQSRIFSYGTPLTPEEKMRQFIIEGVNKVLHPDEFHKRLDLIDYKNDSPRGRVASINKVVCEEGIRLRVKKKRVGGERVSFIHIEELNTTVDETHIAQPTTKTPTLV